MESLFRLILVRPAIQQSDDLPSIRLSQNSEFQAALGKAQRTDNPRNSLKRIARSYTSSSDFIFDPESTPLSNKLFLMGAKLDALETTKNVGNGDLENIVFKLFNKKSADLVKEGMLEEPIKLLKDSLLAIKQLPEKHQLNIEALTNQLRTTEVIIEIAKNKMFPINGGHLRRYRRRSILLPTQAELKSSLSNVERQKELERRRKEIRAKLKKQAQLKIERFNEINNAVTELTKIDPSKFVVSAQKAHAGSMVSSTFRPSHIRTQLITQKQQIAQLQLLRIQSDIGKSQPDGATESRANLGSTSKKNELLETSSPSQVNDFISGKGPFIPLSVKDSALLLQPSAEQELSNATKNILNSVKLQVSEQPLDYVISNLKQEAIKLSDELDSVLGRPEKRSVKRMGNTLVLIKSPVSTEWNDIVVGAVSTNHMFDFFDIVDTRVPSSHGSVAPAGIADLLIVKQQLVRYEGADVAHIENVLRGEAKEREHTRRRETEELLFNEREVTTSEERELESTNRFEMSRETSETIQQDSSLKAGLSVSGQYGPVVEFSVSAEGSVSRSKSEATKAAATFSQDVTQRSANKVTERVLERSSLRVTNEVIEKNAHRLDNSAGADHISGVYQWVNKVYRAQMFNYGIRTMYDFMVPEPGAFLIESMQGAHGSALEIEKPMAFTLRPDQVNEYNYNSWVQNLGATDVQPAPEVYITKSMDFTAGGGDSKTDYNHSGQFQIDEGYKAIYGTVGIAGNVWEGDASIDVVLGNRIHRFSDGLGIAEWNTNLTGETNSLPFALNTHEYSDIAIAVEVKCQRTERAMTKWRLETHAKLTNAYKARVSEYEEKLAALELRVGIAIEGKNPALNLELMKDELKKNCISILTEQYFDMFGAIETGANGMPQLDINENEAEGPYVRFFEQAFEWEHMTWVTYPYFWGRKNQWEERIAYEDNDPIFNQFLKSGYCRVAVPARPGFEGAIDHFMVYGEIWNGGPLPAISNPLYLPIADEIAERLDRPGDEFPEGDPWYVRVPTTLVHLRPDNKLPKWVQDESGEWIEEASEA